MRMPRTILVLVLLAGLGSIVAIGQDREEVIPPSGDFRDTIERLEAQIKRLEKELQQTQEEMRNLKQRAMPQLPLSRPIPYLRFPIEVERAMMGDAWRLRPRFESQPRQWEGSRFESAPQQQRRP
jgi:hypothetical protein